MTHRMHVTIRALSLAVAALIVAASLTVATSPRAQVGPFGWRNGHGNAHGYAHGYRYRKFRYRQRKLRRYYRLRRHHHLERYGPATREVMVTQIGRAHV